MHDLTKNFAAAGLTFLGFPDSAAPIIPPTLATQAVSYASGAARAAVQVCPDDLQFLSKANCAWYEMSANSGLFDGGKFFVAVKHAVAGETQMWKWAEVGLADQWDIMGEGASRILGTGSGRPGFIMLSLDGNVIVRGDTWEQLIDCVLIRAPQRIQEFRRHAAWVRDRPRIEPKERVAIERWLSLDAARGRS
ncbi:hypothetical protein [Actinomadura nitritigenes]|uniref:hypothetical protein n=1 Tax=Actinomadura nitritigenes TaxID=134602 RepID=UPI003D8F35AC